MLPPTRDGRAGPVLRLLFGVALLVTTVLVLTPFAPDMPGTDLDRSWMFAMNQAVAQKLAIGRDAVFTFGPYASIYTRAFHPATDHLMVAGGLYLGFCFFLAAYLNFRSCGFAMQALLVVALAAMTFSADALIYFYPLMTGALVCTGGERRRSLPSSGMLAVLVSPFGLLPLIKTSAMVACLGVTGLMILLLLHKRAWRHLLIVILVPILSTVVFWRLAGQPLADLAGYLGTAGDMIGGYTNAMGVTGNPLEPVVYLACAAVIVASVWRATRDDGLPARMATSMMFAGILFLAFKAGFTRHDFHAAIAASLIMLAALLAASMARPRVLPTALISGIAAFSFIMMGHPPWSRMTGFDDQGSLRALLSGWSGVTQRILEPGKLGMDFEDRLEQIRAWADLPVLDGTSDIYANDQTLLGASGNTWNPRPAFQSYSAYTPGLAERNRQHLLGKDRPDNLFFRLQPIDGRLPSLEDGPSWRVILSDYEPAAARNGFLVLRHRGTGAGSMAQPEAVSTLTGHLGEALQLPPTQGLLFARLRIEPSLLGRFWSLFYKPGELFVTATLSDGAVKTFRLIAGMAQSEFLLSPLIESTAEFGLLYGGMDLPNKRVNSLTISARGWPPSWASDYELELMALPSTGDMEHLATLGLTPPEPIPAEIADQEVDCDGYIDQPAHRDAAPMMVEDGSLLSVEGWMAKSAARSELADETWLVFDDGAGKRSTRRAARILRTDVGDHFGNRVLDNTGFAANVLIHGLDGRQTMTIAFRDGAALTRCRNLALTLDIRKSNAAQDPPP